MIIVLIATISDESSTIIWDNIAKVAPSITKSTILTHHAQSCKKECHQTFQNNRKWNRLSFNIGPILVEPASTTKKSGAKIFALNCINQQTWTILSKNKRNHKLQNSKIVRMLITHILGKSKHFKEKKLPVRISTDHKKLIKVQKKARILSSAHKSRNISII
jgi:hypothetical protein